MTMTRSTLVKWATAGAVAAGALFSAASANAAAWSVGVNWWLNKNIRLLTSFSHTTFTGGGSGGATAPAAVTHQPENALFTRIQLAF